MTRYVLGRVASLVFVVWAVSIVTFVMMHSVPGGPFDETKGRLPPAARENILRKYGLDKPYHVQYLNYMKNALRFDFGISYQAPTSTVSQLILKHWRITAQVGLLTVLCAFGGGITLGIWAAYRQNSLVDNVVTLLAMLGISVPSFVVALWLILIFSFKLGLLPMRGWSSSGTCVIGSYLFCSDWILPVFAYAIGPMGVIGRYTRASVVDVIRQDYTRTARAKGVTERLIMTRHVLRNAQIPMITALATPCSTACSALRTLGIMPPRIKPSAIHSSAWAAVRARTVRPAISTPGTSVRKTKRGAANAAAMPMAAWSAFTL